jgi:hypothetical protein
MVKEPFSEFAQTRVGGALPRRTALAALASASLLLAMSGPAFAAGKMGGVGGADEFQITVPPEVQDEAGDDAEDRLVALGGKVGGGMDGPTRLGGKLGVGTGDD